MASLIREIRTTASPSAVWDAVRDIGALHTRLVPGFVVNTVLEPGVRVVTFRNGKTVREPIVAIDDDHRRLVWGAEGGTLAHYNGALQVFVDGAGSRVVWIADFLPDSGESFVSTMMEEGIRIMKETLDAASAPPPQER